VRVVVARYKQLAGMVTNCRERKSKNGETHFAFFTRGPSDEASFRNLKSEGNKRRQNSHYFDCKVSVALQKTIVIQTHGRMNRAGIPMKGKKRINIVSFLHCTGIQEKSQES
jgi:hypothetical protein